MTTWVDVRIYVLRHKLACTLIRFRDGSARLIDTASGETVAETVEDAEQYLKLKGRAA
jgi:hypothetical protein